MDGAGLCECGCGLLAPIARSTNRPRGMVKGRPQRYILGHATAKRPVLEPPQPCACGCGQLVTATRSARRRCRYIHGHNRTRAAITEADYTVEDRGFDTPCWIWRHAHNGAGYGRVSVEKVVVLAHRAMYEREIGPIPTELELDHLCYNRACVNPAHLEPVTHTENVRRGRAQRLTTEDRATILRLRSEGRRSMRSIAMQFGISYERVRTL